MEPTIYLFFNGNCAEAFAFYEKHLGGKIMAMMRNNDAPPADRMPGNENMVMNAVMQMGNSVIMASDAPGDWYQKPQGFYVSISPSTITETQKIWTTLAEGGSIITPIAETFWADQFGMLVDKFGTPWMFNHLGSKAVDPRG